MKEMETIIVEFDLKQHLAHDIALQSLDIDYSNENKIYWIHCNLNVRDDLKKLISKLNLPEYVRELCDEEDSMPKLIDHDEALAIQLQCVSFTAQNKYNKYEINFSNLIIFLTERYCFTASSAQISSLLEFKKSYAKSIRYAKTPCFILFLLFDDTINDYSRILYNFELITEEMDTPVHLKNKGLFNEIVDVKQQLMKVKRNTIAVREILMRISGRKISVISKECKISLYNLSNHTHMIVHEADSIRDMLNTLLGQIDNSLMQRMNETMRILTVFASIFLPLTLITGIYGMNFVHIPELQWRFGYYYALGLIILCGILLLFIFKKMKWF